MLLLIFCIKMCVRFNCGWWVVLFSGLFVFFIVVGLRFVGFFGVGVIGFFSFVFVGDVVVFVEVGCFVGE